MAEENGFHLCYQLLLLVRSLKQIGRKPKENQKFGGRQMTPRHEWPISPSRNDAAISTNLAIPVQAEDGGSLAEEKPDGNTIDKTMRRDL